MKQMEHLSNSLQKVQLQLKKSETGLIKHTNKGKQIPTFLKGELVDYYNDTDLDYPEFLVKCREIGMLKMVNLTDDLIMGWYREFIKAGWTKDYFLQRCEAIKKTKIFGGSIDIQMWFDAEQLFTQQEVDVKVKSRVEDLVRRGNRLLGDQIIEVTLPKIEVNYDAIKVAVAKRVEVYYRQQTSWVTTDIIDEVLEEVKKRLNLVSKTVEV